MLIDKNNLFNKIADENKLERLFPVNVKKMKLSQTVLERIFDEFSFKFITDKSSPCKIIKEIYNTYFGCHIISSFYGTLDDGKGTNMTSYIVDEHIQDLYEFAKNNLVLDCKTYVTYKQLHQESGDMELAVEI